MTSRGSSTVTGEWRILSPLVLATMASQSLLVVLAPTMVAISEDLGVTVGVLGQARAVTAVVSIIASVLLTGVAGALTLRTTLTIGSVLAIGASALVAAARSPFAFLGAHVLVGLALALLLSGGFAGVAAFPVERRAWATGYVAAANAAAWIVVNPFAAALTEWFNWRAAQAVPVLIALCALFTARQAVPVPGAGRGEWDAPLREPSARRWIAAETVGFAAWTALLTFAGAFFIEHIGLSQTSTGWALAAGAAAYVLASTRAGRLTSRIPRLRLAVSSALAMAAVLPILLGLSDVGPAAVLLFCLIGLIAGLRTPASAGIGLAQLPGRPGAMMAARTAATQLGYLLGALIGGTVIAFWGYATLGWALAAVMALSAVLLRRVDDPEPATA